MKVRSFQSLWAGVICAVIGSCPIPAQGFTSHEAMNAANPAQPNLQVIGSPDSGILQAPGVLAPHQGNIKLKVGICDLPPWTVPPSVGTPYWSGLGSFVWKRVSETLKIDATVQQYDYDTLIKALKDGSIDVGVTGIPIIPQHLDDFSITLPFDSSGISIATQTRGKLSFITVLQESFNSEVTKWMLSLLVLALLFALLFWIVERKRNPAIEGGAGKGFGESVWWSLTTLATVGYGDRVPVTTLGKIVGSFWMACGFILLTVAAAVVTSVLTVERLKPLVGNASQLSRSRIGAVTGTTGARYADANGLRYLAFSNDELAMNALEEDEIQAVIGSTTTLYYLVEHGDNAHVMVLPRPLLRDYLGFGLRFGFDPSLEKRIELEVVKASQSAEYQAMRAAMLGDSDAPRISASSTAEGR